MKRIKADQASDCSKESPTIRPLRILHAIAELNGHASAAKIAENANIPRSSVHRSLTILARNQYVEQLPETKQYTFGRQTERLIASSQAINRVELHYAPILRELALLSGETAQIAEYDDRKGMITITDRHPGLREMGFESVANEPKTPIWGASGRTVIAQLDDRTIGEIYARDQNIRCPVTNEVIPSPTTFIEELRRIKKSGYATSLSQLAPNTYALAAPIYHPNGNVVGAMSISIPEMWIDANTESNYSPLVRKQASKLSAALAANS